VKYADGYASVDQYFVINQSVNTLSQISHESLLADSSLIRR